VDVAGAFLHGEAGERRQHRVALLLARREGVGAAEELALLHGVAGPLAGVDVGPGHAGGEEVQGELRELSARAPLQKQDVVGLRDPHQPAQAVPSVREDLLEGRGAVADLEDREPDVIEGEDRASGLLQDGRGEN